MPSYGMHDTYTIPVHNTSYSTSKKDSYEPFAHTLVNIFFTFTL